MIEKEKKEILENIERRFQFAIILGLFLPFVWNRLNVVYPLKNVPGAQPDDLLGLIIMYIFLGYFILEVSRNYLRIKILNGISVILIILTYALIVVSGLTLTENAQVTGWKSFLLGASLFGSLFLPAFILFLIGLNFLISGVVWLKRRKLKKK